MVTVLDRYFSGKGISSSKFARILIAGLGMKGVIELDTDSKKWENGLEKAVKYGQKKGVKFNFREILPSHFYMRANKMGLLYLLGNSYVLKFKNSKEAREYSEDFMNGKEIKFYQEMAVEFLKKFGGIRKIRDRKKDIGKFFEHEPLRNDDLN